jgi:lipopolysaccharide biosynthesis glycosyltransferase
MKYCFIFVCQQGGLELKSMLLAASLKRYLRCDYECVAAIPQPAAQWGSVSEDTLAFMQSLGVRSVLITNRFGKSYPIGNKLACLGIDTPADKLIFLDSDILCVREFSPDTISPNPSSIFGSALESVGEMKGIFDAPFSAVPSVMLFTRDINRWQQIYNLFDLPLPQWQVLCTGTNELMLPYFSSGVIAVQNGLGFAEIWEDCCRQIDADASITNKYPWLDQLALPVAVAHLNLMVNVLDDRFNYVVYQMPLPNDLPFLCHYSTASRIRCEPRLNQLVNELANIYPILKEKLLNSTWAQLLQPYTLTEKFLYSTKRQIKAFKYHIKRRFHISSTHSQKNANLLGHSSGIKTK